MSVRNMTGVAMPIKIDGKAYQTSTQLSIGMRGEIEAHILSQRPDFMEQVSASLKHFPEKYHQSIIAEGVRRMAMANYITNEEFDSYLRTQEGSAYLFWLLVRDKQPEVDSLEAAIGIITKAKIDLEELQQKLDRAAGLGELKNSGGPDEMDQVDGPEAASHEIDLTDGPHSETTEIPLNICGTSGSSGRESSAGSRAGATGTSPPSTG